MISFALALFLAAVPQAPASLPDPDEVAVTRFYDLRAAMPRTGRGDFQNIVFPLITDDDDDPFSLGSEGDFGFPADLLVSMFGQEFEYEGRGIEVFEGGRLMVIAPEDLQARVAGVLRDLQAAFGTTTEITLDIVRGSDLPPELDGSCVATAEQVQTYLKSAARPGSHERLSVRVGPGRPGVVDIGRRESLLFDYDVEVAEGVSTMDPALFDASLGTRLGLRAAPGAGGLYLAINLRRVIANGDVREATHIVRADISHQGGKETQHLPVVTQTLEVLDRSLALNTFLPEGKVLVIQSRLDLGAGSTSEVIFVSRSGGPLVTSLELSPEGGTGGVSLMDLSAIDPPSCRSSLDEDFGDLPRGLPFHPRHDWRLYFYLNASSHSGIDAEELVYRAMGSQMDHVDAHSSWPWLAVVRPPARESAGPVSFSELSAGLGPDRRLVEVTLTLREKGSRGKALASLSLPVRVGQRSAAILGVENQFLLDFDVEIAKYSAVEDPIMGSVLEGMLVQLEPRIDPAGGLVLDLQGLASRSKQGPRNLDLAPQMNRFQVSDFNRTLEQVPSTQLIVREELRFASGGAKSIVLGDSEGSLALEVEVRW